MVKVATTYVWKARRGWCISDRPPTKSGDPQGASLSANVSEAVARLVCGREAPVGSRVFGVQVSVTKLLEVKG